MAKNLSVSPLLLCLPGGRQVNEKVTVTKLLWAPSEAATKLPEEAGHVAGLYGLYGSSALDDASSARKSGPHRAALYLLATSLDLQDLAKTA